MTRFRRPEAAFQAADAPVGTPPYSVFDLPE